MSSSPPVRRPVRPVPRQSQGFPVPGGLWPIVAGAALIALLGMIIWNVNLRSDIDHLKDDIAAANDENAALRERANATVYQLLPAADGPDNANGQAWFSVQGSGVLSVANMPVPPDGSTYQLWYGTDTPDTPIPGGTFTVSDTGQGFMLIPADVGTITSISISREPEGGSQVPTGPVILETNVDGARG